MKKWLVVLILAVWPLYLYNIGIDRSDLFLDNLRSEIIQYDAALQDGISGLVGLGSSLVQTDIRIIDTIAKITQTLDLSVLDSCGIITNGQGHGSCVAIRSNLMLTAGHCIGVDGAWVEVNGQQYRILKQWKSEQYDVGFVEIEGELPFVELAGRDPELLDRVFLVGSPYDTAFVNTVTMGVITDIGITWGDWSGVIMADAASVPGSSGGPLFCVQSRVIGICVAGPPPYDDMSVCEPVEHIRQALEEYDGGC